MKPGVQRCECVPADARWRPPRPHTHCLGPGVTPLQVYFCGVRGSTPAPGLDFVRYGGHTSSVAFAHDGEAPSLVIDAGTGLRRVTNLLDGAPFQGTILLSHLHWDHTHGLPFFQGGAREGHRVDVLLPSIDDDPVGTLARGLSPPHFPVGPTALGAGWTFSSLDEGVAHREGFDVEVREIPHKGGRTFGFRVTDGNGTLAYFGDHLPLAAGPGPDGLGEYHDAALTLARDPVFQPTGIVGHCVIELKPVEQLRVDLLTPA